VGFSAACPIAAFIPRRSGGRTTSLQSWQTPVVCSCFPGTPDSPDLLENRCDLLAGRREYAFEKRRPCAGRDCMQRPAQLRVVGGPAQLDMPMELTRGVTVVLHVKDSEQGGWSASRGRYVGLPEGLRKATILKVYANQRS
jgi:hypothetical protein